LSARASPQAVAIATANNRLWPICCILRTIFSPSISVVSLQGDNISGLN
jgi:hypothetical protein